METQKRIETLIKVKNLENHKSYTLNDFLPIETQDGNTFVIENISNHDHALMIYLLNCWSLFEMAYFDGKPPEKESNINKNKIINILK